MVHLRAPFLRNELIESVVAACTFALQANAVRINEKAQSLQAKDQNRGNEGNRHQQASGTVPPARASGDIFD